jgi:hypothetical protein
MTSTAESRSAWRVIIRERPDPWCSDFEAELEAERIPIALPHRSTWASALGSEQSLFVGVTDAAGHPRYGCGVDILPLRSLPGHSVYRIQRFGYGLDSEAMTVVLRELAAYARARSMVLRVNVEAFAGETRSLESITSVAGLLGFTPCVPPLRYTRTLRLDLRGSLNAIRERLPRTARRNLRAAQKSGLVVRLIDDLSMASDVAALEREAFARTGGEATVTDWSTLIGYARRHPRLVRIVGIFSEETGSSPELLGFATGRAHGDHIEYASGGTTRRAGLKISIGYPLLWHLIEWGHEVNAEWFDFGGITRGSAGDDEDALGGISDFKRHFGGEEIEVGGEWTLQVSPVRSAVADAISRVTGAIRRLG